MNLFGHFMDNLKTPKTKHEPSSKRITFSPDQDMEIFATDSNAAPNNLNSPHFPKLTQDVSTGKIIP